ncbi:hypothetical protein TRIATDRAFT_311324 [Trichoderma atroviride IMI 206040]|uniref:Uncharacterized protein n=1 Tax=Hypocrea atroviridis (strain ATCC 20476 / IMI 206040) TaxID=452589 RepID=G9P769_HYPAI|nr:uncharacterized protein TRIATDRAFT_311324 [Trichoderma atroviride IMI 206040]EHK40741.1 hypothetical protein TRIATDRAFT_311324 [Trichoderma atroviride IMI 206040]
MLMLKSNTASPNAGIRRRVQRPLPPPIFTTYVKTHNANSIRHSHHEPASQAPTPHTPTLGRQYRAVPGTMPSRKAEVGASPTPNEPSVSLFSKDLTEIQRERALEIWHDYM